MSTRETGLVTPRSPRVPAAALPSRHREYLAALAPAGVLAQLLVAQLTLAATILFALTGRITRWRPQFLAAPAAAGLAWMLAIGPRSAGADYLSVPRRLAGFVAGPGGRHASLSGAFAGLPGQLPLALIAGAAEAGVL